LAREIGTIPQRLVSFAEEEAGNHYAIGYQGMISLLNFAPALFE